jgi:hypothetical protein
MGDHNEIPVAKYLLKLLRLHNTPRPCTRINRAQTNFSLFLPQHFRLSQSSVCLCAVCDFSCAAVMIEATLLFIFTVFLCILALLVSELFSQSLKRICVHCASFRWSNALASCYSQTLVSTGGRFQIRKKQNKKETKHSRRGKLQRIMDYCCTNTGQRKNATANFTSFP